MKKSLKQAFFATSIVAGLFLAPSFAQADCNNLNNNADWNYGIQNVQSAVDAKKPDEAIEAAKVLYGICLDSPQLLYLTGLAFEQKGETERAKQYFRQAAENTSKFVVAPGLARRIWFAHYETEYPDRTEAAVNEKSNRIDALTKELAAEKETSTALTYTASSAAEDVKASADIYKALMWTGVGAGAVGVILAATGGGLMAGADNKITIQLSEVDAKGKVSKELESKQFMPYALLGAGIGMAVVGAVVAGISGYKITHIGKSETPSDGADVSFNLSPISAGLNIVF